MKKTIISKAICIALASAMVLGDAGLTMAYTDTIDVQAAVVDKAEIASASVDNIYITGGSVIHSSDVSVTAGGQGKKAELYVNGIKYRTVTSDWGYWNMDESFAGNAGATYEFKLVVYSENGRKITKNLGKKKFAASGFSDNISSWSNFSSTGTGYTKRDGISINYYLKDRINGKVWYEIYRSTHKSGGYKKIYTGSSSNGIDCVSYIDTKATVGTTYYYKAKLLTKADKYSKKAGVLATSKTIENKYGYDEPYLEINVDDKYPTLEFHNVDDATIFDVYRSNKKSSGFKKIKTVYDDEYTDRTTTAGNAYYYYYVSKYYDNRTGHVSEIGRSEVDGYICEMGEADLEVKAAGTKTANLTWNKVSGANVYEVWYKRGDISGDCYTKAGTTQKTSFTLKNLTPGGYYNVKLKCQNMSYGEVISEKSFEANVTVGYAERVDNLRTRSIKSSLSANKKKLTITTTISWDRVWGASGYMIMADDSKTGKTVRIAKLPSSTRTIYRFKNTGIKNTGMKYSYVYVCPYKGRKISEKNASVSVKRMPVATGVKVSRKSDSETMITWKAVPGADGYSVRRFTQYGMSSSFYTDKTSYVDTGITTGTDYSYFVVAEANAFHADSIYVDHNDEDYKGQFKTYTHIIGRPTGVSASNTAAKTITVKWNKVSGARYYLVYRSTSKNGKYTKVGRTSADNYADKKAVKGKTYYYKVKTIAVGDNGMQTESAYSKVIAAKCRK